MPFFDTVTLNQFIDDYTRDREKKISTVFGYLGNAISTTLGGANTPNIDNCCGDYKKNFASAKTPEDWVKLLLSLGQTAWYAQELKLNKNFSDFCQTLHAVRSYILMTLRTKLLENDPDPFYKDLDATIKAKIEELKTLVETQQNSLYKGIIQPKPKEKIEKLQKTLDATVRDLAYLGDNFFVLISGRIKELFPSVDYPLAKTADIPHIKIKDDASLKPNPNIPSILHLNYVDMFLEIKGKHPLIDRDVYSNIAQEEFKSKYNTTPTGVPAVSPHVSSLSVNPPTPSHELQLSATEKSTFEIPATISITPQPHQANNNALGLLASAAGAATSSILSGLNITQMQTDPNKDISDTDEKNNSRKTAGPAVTPQKDPGHKPRHHHRSANRNRPA